MSWVDLLLPMSLVENSSEVATRTFEICTEHPVLDLENIYRQEQMRGRRDVDMAAEVIVVVVVVFVVVVFRKCLSTPPKKLDSGA
jgi:ABC-type glycerol-3-phosphate transport system permease component